MANMTGIGATAVAPKATNPPGLHLTCSEAYSRWVSQFARARRTTRTEIVDRGLVLLAEREGYAPPPSRIEEKSA